MKRNRSYRSFPRKRRQKGFQTAFIAEKSFVNQAVNSSTGFKESPFVPQNQFADLAVDIRIKQIIADLGYQQPTPIQDQAIPHILRGCDLVGLANTGTGKTAAFLIPLLQKALQQSETQTLILAPTRELAVQIELEFKKFGRSLNLFSALCIGGENITVQLRKLRMRNHFIIGTPGRILDLAERGSLRLNRIATVVLDEADRMLDMGFLPDIEKILSQLTTPRHTLCFSATMPTEITKLIAKFLQQPVTITVTTRSTAENVEQDIVRIGQANKTDILHDLLIDQAFKKVLVFGRTKFGVDKLARDLKERGFAVECIHGNKTHGQRLRSLNRFRADQTKILIATDVAARGLDIIGVTHVINYDLPANYDDYVHRIGRTGRGQASGKALTFVQ